MREVTILLYLFILNYVSIKNEDQYMYIKYIKIKIKK